MTAMVAGAELSLEVLVDLAAAEGVCTRPVLTRVTDTATGESQVVPIPCGSTRESRCRPCAEKNRRLRIQQCREGWHLEEEPPDNNPDSDNDGDDEDQERAGSSRRVRSTRRRQEVPDLPRAPTENRTIGRTFTGRDGRVFRPSMFATLTMGSYGPVRSDGTPVDPSRYDYRRAALDALHFPKLVDRFWQNLRRVAGYRVQYFAAVEPQKRLAPHLHAAIRGVIPRKTFRQVVAATYHQVWWPAHHEPVYEGDRVPVWVHEVGYVDPDTGAPLPTWDEALDDLDADADARPAHVVRFGSQLDLQGVIATSTDADRRVGYLTKYLTKSIADTYGDDDEITDRQAAHLHRLHEEVRWLPCSPRCWNWLRYGIQPDAAEAGMEPGRCPGKGHSAENLGHAGRRVLVSRKWTGKTLAEHRADRAAVVRQVLEAAGMVMPDTDRCAADTQAEDGRPRYIWTAVDPSETDLPSYRGVIAAAVGERRQWRAQYEAAKQRAGPDVLSAIGIPPDTQKAPNGGEAA